MQSVHSVATSSFKVAVTQEADAETQGNIGQEAATKGTATTPGDTQEPPVEGISDQINVEAQSLPPLEPAAPQAQPTISSLQEEIEFLKSQIQDFLWKQDVRVVRAEDTNARPENIISGLRMECHPIGCYESWFPFCRKPCVTLTQCGRIGIL